MVRVARLLIRPARVILLAVVLSLLLSLVLLALRDHLGVANVALLYLIPVLTGATLGGLIPGVIASVVCTLAFDLLFIRPYGTLNVANAQDVLTLLLYLGVGALAADLAGRARARAEEAARRAAANALLYDLSKALLAGELHDVLHALVTRISGAFALRSCAILLPDAAGALHVAARCGPAPVPNGMDGARQIDAVAGWSYRQGEILGLSLSRPARFSDRVRVPRGGPQSGQPGEALLFLPLRAASGEKDPQAIGLLELVRPAGQPLSDEEMRLLTTFATHTALAVERAQLLEASAEAAVLRESDRAKSTLLSNVSHELRTPLTTIRGAADSLLQAEITLDPATRTELLESVRDEAERLSGLVGNLLDLSRIEAGALQPERHLYDLAEVVGGVLARMAPRLAQHTVRTELDQAVGPVLIDYALIDQVVANLVDNAEKYSHPGTTIRISLTDNGTEAVLSVTDEGSGIPSEAQARVFERFYRLPAASREGVPGSGLGLAICRAVVEAHGGRIWIDRDRQSGTAVHVALPHAVTVSEIPDEVAARV